MVHRSFPIEKFQADDVTAADRHLIKFMADQEVGHATMVANILGPKAPRLCKYKYPFTTVKGFVGFCRKLARFGESGVYRFLEHLKSGDAAQSLLQPVTPGARQQMIFRQSDGRTNISQSMTWTRLAPHIVSCPKSNLGW